MGRLPAIHHLGGDSITGSDPWHRLPGSLEIRARYAGLAALPNHIQPFYSLPRPHSLLDPGPLLGLLVVGGLLACMAWTRRRAPLVAFGAGWFLITAVPVLDLVPLSFREMCLADRYLYLPSVGWCLALAWGLAATLERGRWRRLGWTALVGMIVAYSWWLLRYAPVWRDNFTLYARMEQVAPRSPTPPLNLGLTYFRANDLASAAAALERAFRLNPALHQLGHALRLRRYASGILDASVAPLSLARLFPATDSLAGIHDRRGFGCRRNSGRNGPEASPCHGRCHHVGATTRADAACIETLREKSPR